MRVLVTFDAKALDREIAHLDEAACGEFRTQLAGALNEVGAKVHAALIEPLKIQTGLRGATIGRAIGDVPASSRELAYALVTRGGAISLRFFGPVEAHAGVIARPAGVRTYFPGAFIKSGPKGRRAISPKLHGQVFGNIEGGAWGGKIRRVQSEVFIPKEMVRGAAKSAFEKAVAAGLPSAAARVMTLIAGRAEG